MQNDLARPRMQRSAAITAPFSMECIERPIPMLGPGQALVKVKCAGICGSDLNRIAKCDAKSKGLTIGHEFVGVVEDAAEGYRDFRIGDRVVAVPLLPCGKCAHCQRGDYGHCPDYSFIGSRVAGGLAEYVALPAENLLKIPDSIDDEEAVFVEPITVALHAVFRLERIIGSFIVISGAGTIGLIALQLFKRFGAGKVAVLDIVPEKLELAKRLGADYVFDSSSVSNLAPLKHLMNGFSRSIVFEGSNSAIGKSNAISLSLHLGQIVMVGGVSNGWNLTNEIFEQIDRKELDIKGSWMNYSAPFPGDEWKIAIDLLAQRQIEVKPLISHRVSLADIADACKALFDKTAVAIKVLVFPAERSK